MENMTTLPPCTENTTGMCMNMSAASTASTRSLETLQALARRAAYAAFVSDVFSYVTIGVIAIGMIGIGATVHYKVLLYYIKRPKAYIIGVLLQVLLMPLLAWALTKIFVMPPELGLGVFIQGCSPGGNLSNLLVYWIGGIVDLSVAMTITSTVIAFGSLPLWLLIYEAGEDAIRDLAVPYDQVAISLAALVLPLAVGMIVRVKVAKYAKIIARIFITFASISILIIVICNGVFSPVPWSVVWQQGVIAAIMPLIGYALGYLVTLIPWLDLQSKSRKTIAVETGMQNAQVAAAIVILVTRNDRQLQARNILFPILYYLFQFVYSVIYIVIYTLAKICGCIIENEEEVPIDVNEKIGADAEMDTKAAAKVPSANGEDNLTFET